MTLAQLRTKANTKLGEFATALQTRQTAYYLKHNKFFQLLVTSPVVDAEDTTWELITPNDEKHAVDVNFSFNSPIPFQVEVSEWKGEVDGYSITAVIELPNGDRYTRTRTCEPVIQKAVLEVVEDNELNPDTVEVTPKAITGWTENTTVWRLIEEEI